ncbi:MAG: hypothetical protein JSR77_14415 [Planctomycetes bacterium]|nr:hypothetical protein [Planctomycetota bacterium]
MQNNPINPPYSMMPTSRRRGRDALEQLDLVLVILAGLSMLALGASMLAVVVLLAVQATPNTQPLYWKIALGMALGGVFGMILPYFAHRAIDRTLRRTRPASPAARRAG